MTTTLRPYSEAIAIIRSSRRGGQSYAAICASLRGKYHTKSGHPRARWHISLVHTIARDFPAPSRCR